LNYTKSMEDKLKQEYENKSVNNQQFIEDILKQEEFKHLTIKSIRSKLVSMKVYNAEEKTSTKSDVDKKTLLSRLTELTNSDPHIIDGGKNASKPFLKTILQALEKYNEQ